MKRRLNWVGKLNPPKHPYKICIRAEGWRKPSGETWLETRQGTYLEFNVLNTANSERMERKPNQWMTSYANFGFFDLINGPQLLTGVNWWILRNYVTDTKFLAQGKGGEDTMWRRDEGQYKTELSKAELRLMKEKLPRAHIYPMDVQNHANAERIRRKPRQCNISFTNARSLRAWGR